MKRLFITIITGIVAIIIIGGIISGSNLIAVDKNLSKLMVINQSFLERSRLFTQFIDLKTRLTQFRGNPRVLSYVIEQINKDLQRCDECHQSDIVSKKLGKIKKRIIGLKRYAISANSINLNDIGNFIKYSYQKGVDVFISYTSSANTALKNAKYSILITTLLCILSFFAFCIFSFIKIERLEKGIKERENALSQWAIQWQDTFDSVTDMIGVFDKNCKPIILNEAMDHFLNEIINKNTICNLFMEGKGSNNCRHKTKPIKFEIKGKFYSMTRYQRRIDKGCIVVIRDITREKEIEKKMIQQEKMAVLGTLAASIAHEIRNPLTGIMGFSELLLESPLSDNDKSKIQKIHTASLRMEKIINDLLLYSHQPKPKLKKINIATFLDEQYKELQEKLNKQGIRLLKDFSSMPEIDLDPQLLDQVIHNIVDNAVDAIKDSNKGDTIKIKTTFERDTGVIAISDNGPGIPEEIKDKIFEPFFTTKIAGKGTGLGLSICQSFIHALGGQIEVKSTSGKGTTFLIKLPA